MVIKRKLPLLGPRGSSHNQDGQTKLIHGPKSSISDLATICKNLNLLTLVFHKAQPLFKITSLTLLSLSTKLQQPSLLLTKKLSRPKKLLMLRLETQPTLLRPPLSETQLVPPRPPIIKCSLTTTCNLFQMKIRTFKWKLHS